MILMSIPDMNKRRDYILGKINVFVNQKNLFCRIYAVIFFYLLTFPPVEAAPKIYDEASLQQSAAHIKRGNLLSIQGKFEEAMDEYNKSLESTPYRALCYIARGNLYYEMLDFQKAIDDYSRATWYEPKNELAWFHLGNGYYVVTNYVEAIQSYNEALKINNKNENVYYNKANALRNLQIADDLAIENYSKAIELNKRHAAAYNNRGTIYYRNEKYTEAVKDYTKAIALNKMYLSSYSNRAVAYRSLGEEDLANADVQHIGSIEPEALKEGTMAYARNFMTIAYFTAGNQMISEKASTNLLQTNQEKALAYQKQGDAYKSMGCYEEAITNYEKAIELDDRIFLAYSKSAMLYRDSGNLDKAIELYDKAEKLCPESANVYWQRGITRYYMGQGLESFLNFDKAVKLAPYCAVLYCLVGDFYIYDESKEYERFYRIKCYKKALLLNPYLVSETGHLTLADIAKYEGTEMK